MHLPVFETVTLSSVQQRSYQDKQFLRLHDYLIPKQMSRTGQMNHTLHVLVSLTYKGAYRASDVYCIQLLEFGKTSVILGASCINVVDFARTTGEVS